MGEIGFLLMGIGYKYKRINYNQNIRCLGPNDISVWIYTFCQLPNGSMWGILSPFISNGFLETKQSVGLLWNWRSCYILMLTPILVIFVGN